MANPFLLSFGKPMEKLFRAENGQIQGTAPPKNFLGVGDQISYEHDATTEKQTPNRQKYSEKNYFQRKRRRVNNKIQIAVSENQKQTKFNQAKPKNQQTPTRNRES